MKKNCFSKSVALLLAVLLFAAMTVSASAETISPRYTAIASFSSALTISKDVIGNKTSCSTKVTTDNSNYKIELTMELQKDGTTIKTWTETDNWVNSMSKTYYVSGGSEYVLFSTAKVYNASGKLLETATMYSNYCSC